MTIDLDDLGRRARLWRGQAATVGHVTPDEVLTLIERVSGMEKQWRGAWCTHFGRAVSADNPRDCVTLNEPDPCDACKQWLKEHDE